MLPILFKTKSFFSHPSLITNTCALNNSEKKHGSKHKMSGNGFLNAKAVQSP